MKKVLSVLLAVIILVSVFSASFSVFAAANGFVRENGAVYYYKNGEMLTNSWITWKGNLYYADYSGVIAANKVLEIQSKRTYEWHKYFFNSKGILQKGGFVKHNDTSDGYTQTYYYYASNSGALLTGWQTIGGKRYYFDTGYKPYMYRDGVFEINGYGFYFSKGGVLQTGWIKRVTTYDNGEKYSTFFCATKKGVLLQGWQTIGGKRYYFNDYAGWPSMYRNDSYRIDEKIYVFGNDGVLIKKTGWVKLTYRGTYENGEKYSHNSYYYTVKGVPKTGFQKISGKWYYFDKNYGYMYANGAYNAIKGNTMEKLYLFEKSGALTTRRGFVKLKSEDGKETYTYYVGKGGVVLTGWRKINGYYYYFNKYTGRMATGVYRIENENTGNYDLYYFKENGVWVKHKSDWVKLEKEYSDGEKYVEYYYFDDGKALTGWHNIGNRRCYFSEYSGSMYRDGIYYVNGTRYFFAKNGGVLDKVGWSKRDGHYLYTDSNLNVYTGVRTIYNDNGTHKTYLFRDNGYWANNKTGWYKDYSGYTYYFVKGVAKTGWAKIGKYYYHFDNYGIMDKGVTYIYNDNGNVKTYLIRANGVWANTKTGWYKDEYGNCFYFIKGVAKVGWKVINGNSYCFNEYGEMYKGSTYYINGKYYTFRANGTLVK